jgi:hypothetical protein
MGEMKSAFEKAMEKVEKLGKASPEELRRMEYVPKGNALAATYLGQEDYDLEGELTKYDDTLKVHLIEGAEETFLRNIALPQNNNSRQSNKRAMEGIAVLKGKRKEIESIFEQIEHLFNYYEQARQQVYLQLKSNFETQMQATQRAMEQQTGNRAEIRPELHPQFQEELRKALAGLNLQYENVLEEHKQEIKRIR